MDLATGWRMAALAAASAGAGLGACDLCSMSSATEVAAPAAIPLAPVASALPGAPTIGALAGGASAPAEPPTPAPAPAPGVAGRLTLGLLVDARHAGTLQRDGRTIADPADQHLDTTVAQVVAAWRFGPTWSARIYLPFIHHRYEVAGVDGWYTGSGDVVVQGMATWQTRRDGRHFAVGNLFAGLELPTGDSDRLADEVHADAGAGGGHSHGGAVTGGAHDAVHPHDLALGSGSWDPIAGASGFARWGRLYLTGHGQYTWRTEGDHGYRYGSGGMFGAGPGVFLLDRPGGTLGLHLNTSGEFNQRDRHRGVLVEDSGMREITAGPDLTFSWLGRVTGEIGVEFPLWRESRGTHLATNARGHAGMSVRF